MRARAGFLMGRSIFHKKGIYIVGGGHAIKSLSKTFHGGTTDVLRHIDVFGQDRGRFNACLFLFLLYLFPRGRIDANERAKASAVEILALSDSDLSVHHPCYGAHHGGDLFVGDLRLCICWAVSLGIFHGNDKIVLINYGGEIFCKIEFLGIGWQAGD